MISIKNNGYILPILIVQNLDISCNILGTYRVLLHEVLLQCLLTIIISF